MLEIAIRAAREAGQVLAALYARPHEIHVKGLRDILTEADLAAEQAALGVIRAGCPGALIVSEETHTQWDVRSEQPMWFVDPLDGTTNFARGLPMFSVSVGLAVKGQVQCGAVYDPLLDRLYYAERGQGAYLNNQRLAVSDRAKLDECLILLDWPRHQATREQSAKFLHRLAPQVDAVRSRGSAALGLCHVAEGSADVYYQYTLGPWDVAAGIVIVEEAGGKVTNLHGQPYSLDQPGWLATNGLVHQAIIEAGPYQ